jgi:UDP-glucose 4-epimerase
VQDKNGVKRVIFSSTSALYENNKTFPFKESDNINPDLIYSTTKWQAEKLCHSFHHTYKLPIVILRFFNVYGPHQDFKRKQPPLTGYLIKEFLTNGNTDITFNWRAT